MSRRKSGSFLILMSLVLLLPACSAGGGSDSVESRPPIGSGDNGGESQSPGGSSDWGSMIWDQDNWA